MKKKDNKIVKYMKNLDFTGWIIHILLGGLIILLILALSGVWEGPEKDSLLDFSCEELEKRSISRDGKGGRFVTDWMALSKSRWVKKELVYKARIKKGCIPSVEGEEIFDYNYEIN